MDEKTKQNQINIGNLAFSIVDQDIAEPYRKLSPGYFNVHDLYLAQIARNLRTFCAYIKDANVKIGQANSYEKGGTNSDDE